MFDREDFESARGYEITAKDIILHIRHAFKISNDREFLGMEAVLLVPEDMDRYRSSKGDEPVPPKEIHKMALNCDAPVREVIDDIKNELEWVAAINKGLAELPGRIVVKIIFEGEHRGDKPEVFSSELMSFIDTAQKVQMVTQLARMMGIDPNDVMKNRGL